MFESNILSSSTTFLIAPLLGFITQIVGLLIARGRKEEQRIVSMNEKTIFYALLISGISISLFCGLFIFDGDILGAGTADISTIIVFIGLALIVASSTVAASFGKNLVIGKTIGYPETIRF